MIVCGPLVWRGSLSDVVGPAHSASATLWECLCVALNATFLPLADISCEWTTHQVSFCVCFSVLGTVNASR